MLRMSDRVAACWLADSLTKVGTLRPKAGPVPVVGVSTLPSLSTKT